MWWLISLPCTSNPQDSPGLSSKSKFQAWHHAGSHGEGLASLALSSDLLGRKWPCGSHMLGRQREETRPRQSIGEPACLGSASNGHRVMKAMPSLTRNSWDVCFCAAEAFLCSLMSARRAGKQVLISPPWNSWFCPVRWLPSQAPRQLCRSLCACIHPKVSLIKRVVLSSVFFKLHGNS